MRVGIMGAVDSTLTALRVLRNLDIELAGVVTLPIERAGVHSDHADIRPLAASGHIRVVEQAESRSPESAAQVAALDLDYLFVVGWSRVLSPEMIGTARHGTIGYHPAALPQNRGRAVIPWTILQGLSRTASTLFWMDEGIDTGDILDQEFFAVSEAETATTLYAKHMAALETMLVRSVRRLRDGTAPRTPQEHEVATYCARRRPEDGWVDWGRPAAEVARLVRASTRPYPGASTWHAGRQLTIWDAAVEPRGPYCGLPGQVQHLVDGSAWVQCGDGAHVVVRSVQYAGDTPMPAASALRMHDMLGFPTAGYLLSALSTCGVK